MPSFVAEHAPVSKGIVLATAGASILAQAARASRRQLPPGLGTASNLLVLRNPAELLFGALLLYYFRLLERQTGSNKFGAFAFVSTGLSYSLQLALSKLGGTFSRPLPSGPYGLIFACLVQFFCTVPASSKFTVLGWRLSDKVWLHDPGITHMAMRTDRHIMWAWHVIRHAYTTRCGSRHCASERMHLA